MVRGGFPKIGLTVKFYSHQNKMERKRETYKDDPHFMKKPVRVGQPSYGADPIESTFYRKNVFLGYFEQGRGSRAHCQKKTNICWQYWDDFGTSVCWCWVDVGWPISTKPGWLWWCFIAEVELGTLATAQDRQKQRCIPFYCLWMPTILLVSNLPK